MPHLTHMSDRQRRDRRPVPPRNAGARLRVLRAASALHCGHARRLPSCGRCLVQIRRLLRGMKKMNTPLLHVLPRGRARLGWPRRFEAVRDPSDPAQTAVESGLLAPIIARSPWYLQIPLDAFAHFLTSDGWAIASYIAFAVLAAMFPFLIQ